MIPIPADEQSIQLAADLLGQGRLVAFPTETVYGLGADASNPDAVKRIFQAKGRPADHPLIVHIADKNKIDEWAIGIPNQARILADKYWPGPLAMIFNKQSTVPSTVTGGQTTVALRVPNHPIALRLLHCFGGGIAAPSANRFCRISPTQASHVSEELGDAVDLILDGGACQVGVESTIIDFSGTTPALIRPGHISRTEIEVLLNSELSAPVKSTIRAPGMMEIHYAPMTPAALCPSEQLNAIIEQLLEVNQTIGVLTYQQKIKPSRYVHVHHAPSQAHAYAQSLYAALRGLDHLQCNIILVEQTPATDEWHAINDRVSKATLPWPAIYPTLFSN
jgi:L-threonylcarbamoyladenylate synthase